MDSASGRKGENPRLPREELLMGSALGEAGWKDGPGTVASRIF